MKSPCGVMRGAVDVTYVAARLAKPPAVPAAKYTTVVVAGVVVGDAASHLATLVDRRLSPAESVIPSNAPLSVILLLVLFFL